jgi:hypothetical protein
MAAFSVTTWSLSQMEHKDMLHATYRLSLLQE